MNKANSFQLEEAVQCHFFHQAKGFEAIGGGFSGTPIFRFSSDSEMWVARGWPCSEESRNKIENWAKVALHLEQHATELSPWFDCSPIPRPVLWQGSLFGSPLAWQVGDQLWTLTKWVPGEALKSECVTYDLLLNYVKQLACLHRLTREMQFSRSLSKGLMERRDHLVSMQTDLSETAPMCSRHPLKSDLSLFFIECADRIRIWLPTIDRLANCPWESHWILRDLWRDNLLVDANNLWIHTVDVGASRLDWPAFDFVRLVGSLLESRIREGVQSPWDNLLDAYNTINPYSDLSSPHDLQVVHEVSTAISILFWAKKWGERNVAPETEAARLKRMKELLKIFLAK
jgi:hypothetical protein